MFNPQSLHFNNVIAVFFLLLFFELYRVLLFLLNKVADDLGYNDGAFALKTENKKIEVSFFFLILTPFFTHWYFNLSSLLNVRLQFGQLKGFSPV